MSVLKIQNEAMNHFIGGLILDDVWGCCEIYQLSDAVYSALGGSLQCQVPSQMASLDPFSFLFDEGKRKTGL